MPKPFLDPNFTPDETSARLVFSGGRLDRESEIRSEICVEEALEQPTTRLLGFAKGRLLVELGMDQTRGKFTVGELASFNPEFGRAVMLGHKDGADHLAVPLAIDPEADGFSVPEPFKMIDYRSLGRQLLLSHDELGNAAYGGAMLAWHATNGYCAQCGQETRMGAGGAKRVCTSCKKEHFPRTDPVVIMLTIKGDKCLLGRSHHFVAGMYSALAGFVEPGETIESAVRRETFEESGIRVGKVTYHATQPWPFPHTLMIGCYGEALDAEIVKDELELDDCRWFSRTEVLAILDGDVDKDDEGNPLFTMPPPMAIANRLISDWANESPS